LEEPEELKQLLEELAVLNQVADENLRTELRPLSQEEHQLVAHAIDVGERLQEGSEVHHCHSLVFTHEVGLEVLQVLELLVEHSGVCRGLINPAHQTFLAQIGESLELLLETKF
jgi:hypothetical protein